MTTINELPAHVLLVHLVVVLVPLSAFMVLLTGCWPAARRRFDLLTAALAGLALVSVPLTTDAGEWLERHLPSTPLVRAHTQLGDTMLPWAAGLFLVAAALAAREFLRTLRATSASATAGPGAAAVPVPAVPVPAVPVPAVPVPAVPVPAVPVPAGPAHGRRATDDHGLGGRPVSIALAVLALIVAVGSTVTVYRIGDSGARAAWTGNFSRSAIPSPRQQAGGG